MAAPTIRPRNREPLGRYVVVLDCPSDDADAVIRRWVGGGVARSSDFGVDPPVWPAGGDSLLLDRLGIAIVRPDPDRAMAMAAERIEGVVSVEPEVAVYATGDGSGAGAAEQGLTWGLRAIGAGAATARGAGIKVAVLDTGVALDHPELAGRIDLTASFIEGETVTDGNGHGTHCAGTIGGADAPDGLRYGVAPEVRLMIGKVLSDEGRGGTGSVLAGINWAIENGADIVSMSLGSPASEERPFSPAYEQAARIALENGTLMVAAAGNDSERPEKLAPVGDPASCPSVVAVAALDRDLAVAAFSNAGLRGEGAEIDLAAPGVDIFSAWPAPDLHRRISGTSMATPHVAGAAALHASARGLRGRPLWDALVAGARNLDLPARDVGAGLVRCP